MSYRTPLLHWWLNRAALEAERRWRDAVSFRRAYAPWWS
jgi:hypothetical protein